MLIAKFVSTFIAAMGFALAAAFAALSLGFAAAAQADPALCVYPDGTPCTPPQPGCVQPENALPCSSSLPDVNAAIRQQLGQIFGGMPLG